MQMFVGSLWYFCVLSLLLDVVLPGFGTRVIYVFCVACENRQFWYEVVCVRNS